MAEGVQPLPGTPPIAASLKPVRRFDITAVVWVIFAILLAVLILRPVFYLVIEGFTQVDELGGGWGLGNYIKVFTDPLYRSPVLWTMIIATSVGVLSLVVGSIMAWCVSRTDIPYPGFIRNSVLISFITPPFLGAIAWIFLAGPKEGWLNVLFRIVTRLGPDSYLFNIFTMSGVTFAMTLYTFPLVFIVVMAGLNNISSDVEDAANIAGGGTLSTMVHVTLPLVLPALLAGFIMAFLEAMILFGIPAVLSIPAGKHVMTTQLRAFMASEEDLLGYAAAYSAPMLLVAIGLVWTRGRLLGKRGYATIGGKGGQRRHQKLGAWKWPVFGLCMIPVACAIPLPYFALVATSFMRNLGGGLVWENFTLDHYRFVFTNDAAYSSIINSLYLSFMAATAATLVAAVIAFISQRQLVKGHKFLAFLATAPIGIPGIVLAIGLFAAYTQRELHLYITTIPIPILYGTIWILFLAYLTKYLPLAFQTSNAALMSIHPELEECSRILGANRLQVFKDVTMPLFKVGLLASWILVFMPSMRELSASILLWTSRTKVVSVVIVDFYEESLLGQISALGVILLLITLVFVWLGFKAVGRDFMKA